MFVGHGLLAFAVVGLVARRYRRPREALALAALAAAFATLPDVDIAYAPVGVLTALTAEATRAATPLGLAESFWATGNEVHRSVTHSVVLAPALALAGAAWLAGRRVDGARQGGARSAVARAAAFCLLCALTAVATLASGALGGAVLALCGLGAIAVAEVTARRTAVRPPELFAVALFGLVSHPFGDVFTGDPPALLYPLGGEVLGARVALLPDPTLHLLGAFGIELATLWAGLAVLLWLTGRKPTVAPRAALALGYAVGVLLIPAPTLDLSYPFVFSVLGVGLVGALPPVRVARRRSPGDSVGSGRSSGVARRRSLPVTVSRMDAASSAATALVAVTLAWLAYGVTYVAL